jgi:sugar (pentulose or hexulose) kinase
LCWHTSIIFDKEQSKSSTGENALAQGASIIADFGKTLSKVTLWSKDGRMIDRFVRPTVPQTSGEYRALDVDDTRAWFIDTLARFASHRVEAIIPVAHGAAVVGLQGDRLAFPPLDYEHAIQGDVLEDYRNGRDAFALTGSPALPDGLNIGSQLHWLENLHGETFRNATLLPYAQYWAWLLSGEARSEVTSLGCHSDLWNPAASDFSQMAKARGWASMFAPLAKAGEVIGTLRPELAAQTGLPTSTKIYAGLHDSNAALLAARGFAEIAGHEATVLSTGTWFVAMRSPQEKVDLASLPEARDCLVNVDAYGAPVPSARFMGGREIETQIEIDTRRVDIKPDQPALLAAVLEVLASDIMLLPTFAPGFGPFAERQGRWINRPENWFERRAATCIYAALVAETSLSFIGTKQLLLVEGRFAEAEVFVRALASLRPDLTVYTANAHNNVSFGALRLINPELQPDGTLNHVLPLDQDLTDYAIRWRALVA